MPRAATDARFFRQHDPFTVLVMVVGAADVLAGGVLRTPEVARRRPPLRPGPGQPISGPPEAWPVREEHTRHTGRGAQSYNKKPPAKMAWGTIFLVWHPFPSPPRKKKINLNKFSEEHLYWHLIKFITIKMKIFLHFSDNTVFCKIRIYKKNFTRFFLKLFKIIIFLIIFAFKTFIIMPTSQHFSQIF